MLVTVQSVESRYRRIERHIRGAFEGRELEVFTDEDDRGSEWSFRKMLTMYNPRGFRLHIQDSAIIGYKLNEYLHELQGRMVKEGINAVALCVPSELNIPYRSRLPKSFHEGRGHVDLTCTLFSEKAVSLMASEVKALRCGGAEGFVRAVLSKHGVPFYFHYPGLVQCMNEPSKHCFPYFLWNARPYVKLV